MDGYTLSDIAAVNGNNNGMFGDGNGWWIILLFIILAANGGWGNGAGMFGGNGGGAADSYVLASDFAQVERKMDTINGGLCDGFYAMNTNFGNLNNTLATNFAQVQSTLCQGFSGINAGLTTQGYETRIAIGQVGTQLAQCCCDIKGMFADLKYNMATQTNAIQGQIEKNFCDTNYAMATNTRDILQETHADTDRIMARLDQMERNHDKELLQAEREKNAALQGILDRQALAKEILDGRCGCGC